MSTMIVDLAAGILSAITGRTRTTCPLPETLECLAGDGEALRASMDLTRTTSDNKKHWRAADGLSPRASYTLAERKTARERSRLEAENNSWYSGMLRTTGNHVVGPDGPRLQVLTENPELNTAIETAWAAWARAVNLAATLRLAVETYWRDGEVFCLRSLRSRRPYGSPISLDLSLYEADQITQPYFAPVTPEVDDGIRLDRLSQPVEYWILDNHPGEIGIGYANFLSGNWYPASEVWHLFKRERPRQVRGIPRCAPGLPHLAKMRRFGTATLGAAESAAHWGVFVKTTSNQIVPANTPGDFLDVDYVPNTLNFLPEGWEPSQLRADHPATTNEMFQRSELTYFARASNQPYSLASGSNRDSNFSSAKMDLKNLWEPEVKAEQGTMSTVVMAPVFMWFLEDLAIETEILDEWPGLLEDIAYQFVWPPLPQSDEESSANAADKRMTSGQTTPSREAAAKGTDYETECAVGARDYGVSIEEYKRALFYKHFSVGGAPGGQAPPEQPAVSAAAKRGGWVTIGKGNSRTRVFLGSSGRIEKGPAGLQGETLDSLGSPAHKARQAHAAATGQDVRNLTPEQFREFGSANFQKVHQAAATEAKAAGVATKDVLQNMPSAHRYLAEQVEMRESAREYARKLSGLNAGSIAKIENNYRDHSTVKGWDETSRSVAMVHRGLGLDPDGHDTPAAVWDLIKEGKQEIPKLHSPEVARQAAEWVAREKKASRRRKPRDPGDDDAGDWDSGFSDSWTDNANVPFAGTTDISAGDQTKDTRGRWLTNFASGHGTHSVKLPTTGKVSIAAATQALAEMGFVLTLAPFDTITQSVQYTVTNRAGKSTRMTPREVVNLAYSGARKSSTSTMPPLPTVRGAATVNRIDQIFAELITKGGPS